MCVERDEQRIVKQLQFSPLNCEFRTLFFHWSLTIASSRTANDACFGTKFANICVTIFGVNGINRMIRANSKDFDVILGRTIRSNNIIFFVFSFMGRFLKPTLEKKANLLS